MTGASNLMIHLKSYPLTELVLGSYRWPTPSIFSVESTSPLHVNEWMVFLLYGEPAQVRKVTLGNAYTGYYEVVG